MFNYEDGQFCIIKSQLYEVLVDLCVLGLQSTMY